MKKFSKISDFPIKEEPKEIPALISESDIFKMRVAKLMDDFLRIQMYGPITRYHVAGTMKIEGKELFLEALNDMISGSELKDKILESSNFKDEEILESIKKSKLTKSKEFIKSIYDRYKDDKEMMMKIFDRNISKIKNGSTAYWRSMAADDLSSDSKYSSQICKEISNKFRFKSQQLGFR